MATNDQDDTIDSSEKQEREPLVNWPKAPTLANLKQDFEEAKPIHQTQKTKIDLWLDNMHIKGKAKPTPKKGHSAVQPMLIRKQAEWRYPALSEPFLSTDEIFDVKPVTWEDREAAKQNELVLNNQFNAHIDKVTFIDEYVRALVDEGTAILRTGWNFIEEDYTEREPVAEFRPNALVGPLHQQIAELKERSPSQYMTDVPDYLKEAHDMTLEMGVPIEAVIVGYRDVVKQRTVKNHPTVEVCDYRNVIIDPTCLGDMKKAKFVIHSFESSLTDLRQAGIYKNLDMIKVEDHSVLAEPDHSTGDQKNFDFEDKPRRKLVVYEYWGFWDYEGTGIVKPFVAAWVGNTLIRMEENPYPDKQLPFITVSYLPVRRSVYGEPDGALLEDNQKIVGAVTRGMIDIMGKSANGQTGMRKDMLDATNRRRFERGEDYDFNQGVDPRQGVYMHQFPEIPASAQFMLELQNAEAESITGVKNFYQGVSGASLGEVAAGVRGALDASSKRELGILRRAAAGIVEVGRKFIAMNSEFLSEEEVVRITNEKFVTVRRDDLAGQFDLRLTISTAEEDASKAQELAFMLQTLGNSMPLDVTKMVMVDIANLRKMPDLAKKIEEYQPQPDPLQQQKALLEIKLLEAKIAEVYARTQNLGATAMLNQAKAGTEEVKQGNIQSDTDQKNLDFIEQESGVKQERDLQRQGEQARSQSQLKVLDLQKDLILAAVNNQKKDTTA